MKLAFLIILQGLIAGFCLYFGIRGFVGLHDLVSDRKDIADNGILTEGTISEKTDARVGKDTLYLARYKFVVEGYENPRLRGTKKQMEELRELFDGMPESIRAKHPDLFDRSDLVSTVYGEDFRSVFDVEASPGASVKVMYDPNDPERNIGGDRREATYWDMTKGFRLVAARIGLTLALGLLSIAYLFLSVVAVIKILKQRSTESKVTAP